MATAPRASDGAPAGGRTPPGPPAHPLWGHARESGRDRLGFRLALAARYGDVARYRLGPVTLYQVSHPEHIARVLQDNARNYDKNTVGFRLLRPVLGDGLLTSDGAPWLARRRLMQPAFHRRRIAALGATMTGAAERMLDAWGPVAARGGALDIAAAMGDLTFGIATATLFGADGGVDAAAIRRAVAAIGADVAFRLDTPFYPPPLVPTPRNRRVLATRRLLERVVDDLVARRRRAGGDTDDLLALLLAARDAETGAALDDRQLRDEAITLLLAGHETTANALSWAWYLLATHPDAERRLATELAAVLGGRTPTTDDLPRLPYTRMVVEETLRLYPPAWVFTRRALGDDRLGPYRIPAGATVAISPYVTHRRPDLWPRPAAFAPERFAAGDGAAPRPRYAYLPFGGGPRQCIGNAFALTELQLVLATIARRYRLRLAPGQRVEPQALVTLRPRDGLRMLAEPR